MPLELINAIASLFTAAVIGATAIAAIVQLRHMRAGNQSTALLSIEQLFDDPSNIGARDIVRYELPAVLADADFRTYLFEFPTSKYSKAVPTEFIRLRRAAAMVANLFEVLGTLVKNRVVPEAPFIDIYGSLVTQLWNLLEAYIAITREGAGSDSIFENFEYLAARSKIMKERMPSFYPKGTPRLTPRNPWSNAGDEGAPPPAQS